VRDREAFEPYWTGIAAISAAQTLYPDSFEWRNPPYEYEREKLPIEILCGGMEIPDMIRRQAPLNQVRQSWQDDVDRFLRQREPYLLY
jgi:uncharacterized protein YbbC (DUF1343 family)